MPKTADIQGIFYYEAKQVDSANSLENKLVTHKETEFVSAHLVDLFNFHSLGVIFFGLYQLLRDKSAFSAI